MTCYLRHLSDVFDSLGLVNNGANRGRLDAAIRTALSVPTGARCPEVWEAVKAAPRDELIAAIAVRHGIAEE